MHVTLSGLGTLLLLVACGTLCECGSMCIESQVSQCTDGRVDQLGQQIAPIYTTVELDELCQNWTATKPCIEGITDACVAEKNNKTDDLTNTVYDTRKMVSQSASEWTLGYEYICDKGKATYGAVHTCMNENENLTLNTEKCFADYENKTWFLDYNEPTNTYKYCTAAKDMLKCLKSASEEVCEIKVADWIYEYHSQLWAPHLSDIECSLESKFSSGALAIVSICSTAAAIVLVLSLASLCLKPPDHPDNKKKQDAKKASSTAKLDGVDNKAYNKENGDAEMNMTQDNVVKRQNASQKSLEITQM